MKKITATIKLVPGNRGFFDPLTGIKLNVSNSIGYIYEDYDVSNIRKAIKEGKIKIVGGKLPPAITIKPVKESLNETIEKETITIEEKTIEEIKRKIEEYEVIEYEDMNEEIEDLEEEDGE